MSSTFKNRIPRRKYRERAQPSSRQHLGLLEKKKDYKQRAKNYHKKEDQLKLLRSKASLKNDEEFYFKMLKGKRNEQGKFIEADQSDSDFDQKQYRNSLKTENYTIVKHQRSIVMKKIEKLKADLHLLTTDVKLNKHIIFVQQDAQIQQFDVAGHFKTTPQLLNNNILDVSPTTLTTPLNFDQPSGVLKNKYNRLVEYLEKERKLTKLMLKISYQKNLLGKQRSVIKKYKEKKIHKFFMERKK